MEPWEELDIDDSEVSSFVRPAKRQALCSDPSPSPPQSHRTLTPDPSPPAFILRPCSQLRHPPAPSNSQQSSDPEESPPQQAESSGLPRRIPGPAGSVQEAMRRKARNSEISGQGEGGNAPIPTQEYIRRAVKNVDEDDGDFALNPWVCAVDYIRREGLVGVDGVAIGTPLCSIKSGNLTDKVAQVVAVIKSCAPNGLGDLTVTLKDPTGSIGATIHRGVLSYGNFGKEISVGAVLILEKVAVFSPAPCARYLNITLNNITKVISKDIGPLSDQTCPVPGEKHTSVAENNGRLSQSVAAVHPLRSRTDEIMSGFRQGPSTSSNPNVRRPFEQSAAVESFSNFSHNEHVSSTEREPTLIRNHGESNTRGADIDVQTSDNGLLGVPSGGGGTGKANHGGSSSTNNNTGYGGKTSNTREVADNAGRGKINGEKEHEEATVSTSSVPEWTDEQLDELLEYDV